MRGEGGTTQTGSQTQEIRAQGILRLRVCFRFAKANTPLRMTERHDDTFRTTPRQSTVLTSSGSRRTNMQLPVAVEQERIPRRRIFSGVSSGKVRRNSAVRRASVQIFSLSSPLTNFTASAFAGVP